MSPAVVDAVIGTVGFVRVTVVVDGPLAVCTVVIVPVGVVVVVVVVASGPVPVVVVVVVAVVPSGRVVVVVVPPVVAPTNVSAVTSGPLPPNPSELLGSARMQEILERLKARFDVVLLDSPPALVVTDASVLATLADGLLIVTRARHTRTAQLRATVEELAQSGRPIAGIIINRVASRDAYYYYGRGYGRAYGEVPDREAAAERLRVGDLTAPTEAVAALPSGNGASHGASNGDLGGTSPWSREGAREAERESVAAVVLDDEPLDDESINGDGDDDRGRRV